MHCSLQSWSRPAFILRPFDADEHAVAVAEADNVGDAAAALGVGAPAGLGGVVDAGGVLAPDGVAVVGEKGQDAAGRFRCRMSSLGPCST